MKRALVIGIDDYPEPNQLNGSVSDANGISAMLKRHGSKSPNFDVRCITSDRENVTTKVLSDALKNLFMYGGADTALFYFAGHGVMTEGAMEVYLVSQDGTEPTWGVSLTQILGLANGAHPNIESKIILIDSCRAGFAGEISGLGKSTGISHIGDGVTILAACHRDGAAAETNGHGTFTELLLDGLDGAASDVLGRVTPAALYSHVDQTLGAWEQRPIYKANVQNFVTLREVEPKVSREVLRKLPDYFPKPDSVYPLDPSHEPDRGEEAERLSNIEVNEDHVKIYRDLQKCCSGSLVVPVKYDHMWHAAVFSSGCKLTAAGVHYRRLAEKNQI